MKHHPFSKLRWVSLDVQPNQLKFITAWQKKDKCIIEQAVTLNCPAGIFQEGLVKRFDVLSAFLAEQISHYGLNNLPAMINLPAAIVRMEKLSLPAGLSVEAMEALICNYVQRDLPQRNENLAIDFTEAGKMSDHLIEVSFAATRKDYITNMNDCITAAGLRLKVIDVDVHCLKRLLPIEKTISACLHISNQQATLMVCSEAEIIFHKQWTMTMPGNVIEQLPQQLALCYAALGVRVIRKWFICCEEKYQQQIIEKKLFSENELSNLQLSTLFTLSPSVDENFFSTRAADFAFACGAVKRMVTAW